MEAFLIRCTRNLAPVLTCLLLANAGRLHAEAWPTLQQYVAKCILVVQARVVSQDSDAVVFEVEESWTGHFDPRDHDNATSDGKIALHLEHGLVDVHDGQTIVLFFTADDRRPGEKISRHSTAFPVRDGKIVYASTSSDLWQEFSLPDFKKAVVAAAKAAP